LLAAFRYEMRKFLAFSEQAARDAGIEPQQHQLLLAVRGLPQGARPTVGAVAERLCVQHHTAVALVDKLERRALLLRERGVDDKREVLLRLTPEGEALLQRLSALHRQQLLVAGPAMVGALQALVGNGRHAKAGSPGLPAGAKQKRGRGRTNEANRAESEELQRSTRPKR
jgi:DNA-binding MarR family transcriptional regulator